ncbi:MAG TPA: hypothetical protein PLB25_12005 [Rhodoferax sp.]|nr:hypothetical protein [Rhodoferax sp.]
MHDRPFSSLAIADTRLSVLDDCTPMAPPDPGAATLFMQSSVVLQAGQLEAAEALLRDALQLAPHLAEAHANLAWLLERRGLPEDALQHYAMASELQPGNARIQVNFGAFLAGRQFHNAAEVAYRLALLADPAMPGAWCNLGALQAQTFRDQDAEQSLRTALQLDARHVAAHVNLAFLLLRLGRFHEGWQHLEWRDWYRAIETRLDCPRWQGQPLAGCPVLLVYEAGHGDMIQFCRYLPLVRSRGASRVDVLCHPALKVLLQSLDGVGEVIGLDQEASGRTWHYWVPLLSLPCHFGTRLDTIVANIPYLQAPADRFDHWRAELLRVCPGPVLRVGLVWQGNADFENDAHRSLPDLGILAPLWAVVGVQFFSLQKGPGQRDVLRHQASQPLLDLADGLQDFADTAAVIGQLDLVISVDTAVAHLAGALGKPCWVLLPAVMTDWRWLEQRTDSPWYPEVLRLFRQPRQVGWAPVIEQLRVALTSEVNA